MLLSNYRNFSLTGGTQRLPIYQVDAFTSKLFGGNPAAVVPLDAWIPDDVMLAIAAENNLSETAFFVPRDCGAYHIRWFTPQVEVDMCGHATLATAAVVLGRLRPEASEVVFESKSGPLTVRRDPDEPERLTMDFPQHPVGEKVE